MRHPGIELGPSEWQSEILTTGPMAHASVNCNISFEPQDQWGMYQLVHVNALLVSQFLNRNLTITVQLQHQKWRKNCRECYRDSVVVC